MKIKEPLDILIAEADIEGFIYVEELLSLTRLPVSNIFHARNKKEAERIQKALLFNLVLLDMNLPGGSVAELITHLSDSLPHVPVIVLSRSFSIEAKVEAITLGAQDYLVKGYFDEHLLSKSIQFSIKRKGTCYT